MPEFERNHGEMEAAGMRATRASARLPGLDIEIVHRRAVEDDAEQIAIYLGAAPSLEAFGRALETADPFGFWAQVAGRPWPAATWALAMTQLSDENASRSSSEHRSVSNGTLHLASP
jgi:hypothetical protein